MTSCLLHFSNKFHLHMLRGGPCLVSAGGRCSATARPTGVRMRSRWFIKLALRSPSGNLTVEKTGTSSCRRTGEPASLPVVRNGTMHAGQPGTWTAGHSASRALKGHGHSSSWVVTWEAKQIYNKRRKDQCFRVQLSTIQLCIPVHPDYIISLHLNTA
jgi:hypothetical protein